jgi:formate-dependent nitrite reductase cytochrome c552 subunit
MDGHKEEACLIGLKIKNIEQMGKFEQALLGKIEQHINDNKGLVYRKDNFIVGLFTSLMTKSVKNEITATKVASQIEKELANYNKLAKVQIDFGIAVNSGQLVLKKEADKIKFTSMSNTLPLTKKLADIAKKEFLLSEPAYKKIMTDVKAKRIAQDGFNVYRIEEIKPKEEYNKFVNQFMSRQSQEKPFPKPSWIHPKPQQDEKKSESSDNQKGFEFMQS